MTEIVLFSQKVNKPVHPPLYTNHQLINEVTYHKHLGFILSNDISRHEHMDYMKTKAWSRINSMCKFKFQLDRNSLQVIYISFIRPLLEHADVECDTCAQCEINELKKIQNKAARIVTGEPKLVSSENLLRQTVWEKLSSRRKKYKLPLFYKMQKVYALVTYPSLPPPLSLQ